MPRSLEAAGTQPTSRREQLGERPAAEAAQVVHTGDPVGFHGGFLFLCVLAPVALDLDHQVEEVVAPVAILDAGDEVGAVLADLAVHVVWHRETKSVVLDVAVHARVFLDDAAELRLPCAIADHPVHVAAVVAGLPAVLPRGREMDRRRGADGLVGGEEYLHRPLAGGAARDRQAAGELWQPRGAAHCRRCARGADRNRLSRVTETG